MSKNQSFQLPSTTVVYCHPCTKTMATELRPYVEKGEEIPPTLEVPSALPMYTYAVFMSGGFPVALPVCLRHFIEATKESSIFQP